MILTYTLQFTTLIKHVHIIRPPTHTISKQLEQHTHVLIEDIHTQPKKSFNRHCRDKTKTKQQYHNIIFIQRKLKFNLQQQTKITTKNDKNEKKKNSQHQNVDPHLLSPKQKKK